jgi:hypothetical protein
LSEIGTVITVAPTCGTKNVKSRLGVFPGAASALLAMRFSPTPGYPPEALQMFRWYSRCRRANTTTRMNTSLAPYAASACRVISVASKSQTPRTGVPADSCISCVTSACVVKNFFSARQPSPLRAGVCLTAVLNITKKT